MDDDTKCIMNIASCSPFSAQNLISGISTKIAYDHEDLLLLLLLNVKICQNQALLSAFAAKLLLEQLFFIKSIHSSEHLNMDFSLAIRGC